MTDRFELLSELGAGGMGSVWKARDTATGEIVALKLVHAHLARDPDYVARFEREVEIARRIDSPHVVKVLGYGTRDGIPYMAMEHVEGQSLRDLLRERGTLTWDEAKPIVREVAEGLAAAHAAGVIHRDVKPSNILITPDGNAKLADFGIARALDMTRLTGSSTMLGTPHYMAPDTEVTPASDLYSLGCVLYEMLTGKPPFDGDSQQQVIVRHIRDEVDLKKVREREPRELLAALLEKSPSKRGTLPRSASSRAVVNSDGASGARRWRRFVPMLAAVFVILLGGVVGVLAVARDGEAGGESRSPSTGESATRDAAAAPLTRTAVAVFIPTALAPTTQTAVVDMDKTVEAAATPAAEDATATKTAVALVSATTPPLVPTQSPIARSPTPNPPPAIPPSPGSPSNLSATMTGWDPGTCTISVQVSWQDNATTETGFVIGPPSLPSAGFGGFATTGANVTSTSFSYTYGGGMFPVFLWAVIDYGGGRVFSSGDPPGTFLTPEGPCQ